MLVIMPAADLRCIQIGTLVVSRRFFLGFLATIHCTVLSLVNNGEIGAMGCKEDGVPWTLGIQHLRRRDAGSPAGDTNDAYLPTFLK